MVQLHDLGDVRLGLEIGRLLFTLYDEAALGGCEWLQNGVRESEGVGLRMWSSASSVGDRLYIRFQHDYCKQWSVQLKP